MFEVTFAFRKATKNTFVYEEVDSDAEAETVIGTLYVQKEALKELGVTSQDDELVVTLDVAD